VVERSAFNHPSMKDKILNVDLARALPWPSQVHLRWTTFCVVPRAIAAVSYGIMEGTQSHVAITLKVEGEGWSHTSLLTTTTDAGMREREIIRSSPDAPAGSSLHLSYRDSDGDEVIVKLDELVQHLHNLGAVLPPAPDGPLETKKIRL
jgi:hypothetical protein